jgi:hypothetical protein
VLNVVVFTFALAAAGGTHEPTPPTPPAGPTAPKNPEVPAASHKGEGTAKGSEAGKPAEGGKGEAGKGEGVKGEGGKSEAVADKPGAKGDRKGAEKRAPRAERSAPPPPALSGSALRQELRQSGGEERGGAAAVSERARLEQLASEITRAREALKQDTARLESMLRGGAGGEMRMPIGDPTEPVPAGTPPGAAASKEAMREQITTVSKAMQGMKPEQAAAIIARIDRVLASEILRRMKPADAGAVMAAIKPEVAAELATAIAMRKSIVDDGKKEAKK